MKIETVNFHLENNCNYKCKYCYATFSKISKSEKLTLDDSFMLIQKLKDAGVTKINFAGGEPFLNKNLGDLVRASSEIGMITSIISNGSLIKYDWLEKYGKYLDVIGISLDSHNPNTLMKLGRGNGKQIPTILNLFKWLENFNNCKNKKILKKINTVVTSLNYQEDMSSFIINAGVKRWKIMQVLKIEGENDNEFDSLKIDKEKFFDFIQRHMHLKNFNIDIVPEDNASMIESYVMIDPKGRFYQNTKGIYKFSRPILSVGVFEALNEVGYSEDNFIKRGGLYAI